MGGGGVKEIPIDIRFGGAREPKMDGVYAWVGTSESGEEYVLGGDLGLGPMPFVTSMKSLIEKLRPFAKKHGQEFKAKVQLVKFSHREVLETL